MVSHLPVAFGTKLKQSKSRRFSDGGCEYVLMQLLIRGDKSVLREGQIKQTREENEEYI